MEKQVIFKSALNGFEKASVLRHIDELNSKMQQAERAFQNEREELQQENDKLNDCLMSLEMSSNEQFKELETKLAAKEEELNAKNEQLAHLEAELKKLRQTAEEQKHELTIINEQNRLLQEQVANDEAKSKKYDETAASIGDVILIARQNATHITDEAAAQAEQILADANAKADQMLVEAKLKLCESQREMEELKTRFHSIRQQMDSSIASIQSQLLQAEQCIDPTIPAEEVAVNEQETAPAESAPAKEEGKAEHPLKAILEQAANSNQKKNFFR